VCVLFAVHILCVCDDDMDAFSSSRAHLKGLCSYTECVWTQSQLYTQKEYKTRKGKKNPAEAVIVVYTRIRVCVCVCLSTQKSS
jgi:hypothetical protein